MKSKNRFNVIAVVMAFVLFVTGFHVFPTTVEAASAPAEGTYYFYSGVGNKVLDVKGGKKSNSTNVQIYSPNQTKAQQFKLQKHGKYYKIINVNSGKALDVKGGKKANGTNVQQYTWNKTNAQLWTFVSAGNGQWYIKNVGSGKMLDVKGAKNANGTNVQIYTSNKSKAQKWTLKTVSDWKAGSWTITKNPTCEATGTKTRTLKRTSNTGKVETKTETASIPTKGHKWKEVTKTVTTPAVPKTTKKIKRTVDATTYGKIRIYTVPNSNGRVEVWVPITYYKLSPFGVPDQRIINEDPITTEITSGGTTTWGTIPGPAAPSDETIRKIEQDIGTTKYKEINDFRIQSWRTYPVEITETKVIPGKPATTTQVHDHDVCTTCGKKK